MTETLVTIHSLWRWVVLVGLVVAAGYGLSRWSTGNPLEKATARPFTLALVALDVQVLIGIVLWIASRGWELNAFLAWIHPIGMLLALGLGHAVVGRAARSGSPRGYRNAALGILVTLVIVAGTIPTDAWF